MKIIETGRKLTQKEVNGILKFKNCLDGKVNLAVFSEDVFAIFGEINPSDSVEEICRKVNKEVSKIFCGHPDFNSCLINDKFPLVAMGCVAIIDENEMSPEEFEDNNIATPRLIGLRSKLMETCERKEIIAIVDITGSKEEE